MSGPLRPLRVAAALLLLAGCTADPASSTPTGTTHPDPATPVQPYVASPEPPATVCTRRGRCTVDPDPVKLYFRSCDDVPEALKPLRRGEPGYRKGLDRDRDGIACDQS